MKRFLTLALAIALCTAVFRVPAVASPAVAGPRPETSPDQLQYQPRQLVTLTNPAWTKNAVLYQMNVRQFSQEGTFKAAQKQLPRIRALGADVIWLMPIHPSQDRDHGYAVTDYRAVAPEYGTLADLDELLRQAHARGIGVVIDYVMNHSAAAHPLFTNSRSAADNPWRDWYVWQNSAPSGWNIYGSNPWYGASSNGGSGVGAYFAGFWSQMPDFNLKNARVAEWHRDNLRFWLNRGVDGFRFDAVGNLVENGPAAWENQPENHALMAAVQGVLAGYSRRFLVCEAPGQPRRYAEADSCGSAFAFGQQYDIVSAAKGDTAAIARVAAYRSTASDTLAGFASNHDGFAGERLWDQLGGDGAKMRLAAATYLLSSPTAFVYYGEEIGMAGASGLSGDPALRTPMSWTGSTTRHGRSSTQCGCRQASMTRHQIPSGTVAGSTASGKSSVNASRS